MQRSERVVSNTSPLLNLALIERLALLEDQFTNVEVLEQVWEELREGRAGLEQLEQRRDGGFIEVVTVDETELYREFCRQLDRGEAAAIALALQKNRPVLLDEREARATAQRHELSHTGVIGVLLRAPQDGAVDFRDELDALRSAGFWISDELYERALDQDRSNVEE